MDIDLLTMDEAGLCVGGCVTGLLPLHDYRFAVDYNQNAFQIWFAGAQPKMTMKNGPLEIDFAFYDDYMKTAKELGIVNYVWFLGGNPYGFNMAVPKDQYNLGELYNLSIRKGTLSPEDRFKINEHIIQTIIMLNQLEFPQYLANVAEFAGAHHETMIGTGYPRGLKRRRCRFPHA